MKQKAVISGSHGFIGSHLVKRLQDLGIETLPLDRVDLHLPFTLKKKLEEVQPDYIFHLGAYGNMINQQSKDEIFRANLEGIFTLLKSSVTIPYRGFINMSTSSVNLNYETLYSATKAGGERLVKAFVNEYDKPIVNLRPYSIYGEGEADFRFIPTVFRSCLTGEPMRLAPDPTHDWVYIDNAIGMLIETAINAEKHKGGVIECGTGIGTTNSQVVALIEEITGKPAIIDDELDFRHYDSRTWYSDHLDSNAMSLRKGIEKIYPHFKQRYA